MNDPNYEIFKAHLLSITENATSCLVSNPLPQQILQLEAAILQHFRDRKVQEEVGFDATFHFRINLVPKKPRTMTVCLAPLTPLGLDVCLALGIRIDESVQKRIRTAYNESLARSIETLQTGPDQATKSE
jgi:hypothetical protein